MSRGRHLRRGLWLPVLLALAACGSDDAARPGEGAPAPQPTEETLAVAANCSWLLRSDPDLLNIAYPDEGADYWVAAVPALPGTRLRIEGQYPQARYFSYNTYDPALRPTDARTDYQLDPVEGGNPYRAAAPAGGRYRAYVEPGAVPATRSPNTLYAGEIRLPGGAAALPNPAWVLIYRIYLAEGSRSGSVPLPTLTLEAQGQDTPIALESCRPQVPQAVPALLNDLIRTSSDPGVVGLLPVPIAPDEPALVRFYGLPETLRLLLSNAAGFSLPLQAVTAGDTGGGFLSNTDNAYVTTMMSREQGSLYLLRGRAPSHASPAREAPLGAAQLRYWSICTNEFVSQRYVACLHDAQVPLDAQGYFTIVVSDPAERPATVDTVPGLAWLPWGAAYPDSVIIYRHMLPSPHYAQAIQNVPYGTPAVEVMGEDLPRVRYCDRATIEAAGSAAAAFAACGG